LNSSLSNQGRSLVRDVQIDFEARFKGARFFSRSLLGVCQAKCASLLKLNRAILMRDIGSPRISRSRGRKARAFSLTTRAIVIRPVRQERNISLIGKLSDAKRSVVIRSVRLEVVMYALVSERTELGGTVFRELRFPHLRNYNEASVIYR